MLVHKHLFVFERQVQVYFIQKTGLLRLVAVSLPDSHGGRSHLSEL